MINRGRTRYIARNHLIVSLVSYSYLEYYLYNFELREQQSLLDTSHYHVQSDKSLQSDALCQIGDYPESDVRDRQHINMRFQSQSELQLAYKLDTSRQICCEGCSAYGERLQ